MPRLDKRAVMRDAHLRYRQGKYLKLGWTWAQCLRTAWAAAKIRQSQGHLWISTDRRRRAARDFIFVNAA